jgi:hypothetical protein
MKSFAEKQVQIDSRRSHMMTHYPDMWARILSEWRSPGVGDRAWLMFCANYLMRTGNVRWALDPLRLHQWLPEEAKMDVARDLRDLSFVLLTHEHDDHLDLGLIHLLRDLPIRWVVPQAILSLVVDKAGLSLAKIIVPEMMVPLKIEGIIILPFEGMHWQVTTPSEKGSDFTGPRGVPSTGYLVEFSGKRWLFPGDVRTYDATALRPLGRIDGVFAHLWLGRGSALISPPPLLDAFCRFCIETGAQRVVLAHLEEFGRDANDYWDADHVVQVESHFRRIAPGLPVTAAYMGESIEL